MDILEVTSGFGDAPDSLLMNRALPIFY